MSRAIKLARAGYSGDPGLFGFLGGIAKKVTGIAGSFLPGPLGAAARGVSGLIPGGARAPAPAPAPLARAFAPAPPILVAQPGIGRGKGAVSDAIRNLIRGRAAPAQAPRRIEFGPAAAEWYPPAAAGVPGAAVAAPGGPADGTVIQRDDILVAACPSGMRPNKSAYYEMSPGGGVIFHPPGTKCVSIQKRNPANARATDRAISRVKSAKRYAASLSRITIRDKCCRK